MKFLYLVILVCLINCPLFSQTAEKSVIGATKYFEFHSNYWINLHHFLYQAADSSQLRKLQKDGNQLLDIGEAKVFRDLTGIQLGKLNEAIQFYQVNIVQKNLIRDLGFERVWLQKQTTFQPITDTTFTRSFTYVLNLASDVYKETFWPIHKALNEATLNRHLSIIQKMEAAIIAKMEVLSMQEWPSQGKVRVDLSAYANYAGAYTPTRPRFNIFISSLDPSSEHTGFVETIFHEGSHLLFSYGGSFRGGISGVFDKMALQIDYPRLLWHASLFYLCGRTVQDGLKHHGINGHLMTMDERSIFNRYNTANFRKSLETYYVGESNFETAISSLLNELKDE